MALHINLADINIGISFCHGAEKAVPLFEHCFAGFVQSRIATDAELVVATLNDALFPFLKKTVSGKPVVEQRLSAQVVIPWLQQQKGFINDISLSKETICASCLDGLLLFDPPSSRGWIYLCKEAPGCFQPLPRLFWMFFAQVLGEKGCCFVHGAAVSIDNCGYLFLGHSGAGKSTVAQLCKSGTVLCDDSPIIQKRNGHFCLFASPFHQLRLSGGLNEIASKLCTELKAVYFLNQSEDFHLEKIPKPRAVSTIIGQHIHFFPYLSRKAKTSLFDLFLKACHRLPTYKLYFSPGSNPLEYIASNSHGEKHVGFR